MPPPVTFVFNFFGLWKKDSESGKLLYDGYNSEEIKDNIEKMTYERILDEFAKCYDSKPNKVYALDEDYHIEAGLVLLRDSTHCLKVFDYFECLGAEQIMLFADHNDDPMPPTTLLPLFDEALANANDELENTHGVEIEIDVEGIQSVADELETGEGRVEGQDRGDEVETGAGIEADLGGSEDEGDHSDHTTDDSSMYTDNQSATDDEVVMHDPVVDSAAEGEQGYFALGMTFAGAKDCRESINNYAVRFGYKIKFLKNEPQRIRVVCIGETNCPFVMLASKDGESEGLVIKTLTLQHTCCRQIEVPSTSQKYLANYFKEALYRNPTFSSKDMQGQVKDQLNLHVSLIKCKRAKRTILTKLQGSYKEEFNNLVGYIEAVKQSNPGTVMELQLSKDELANGKRVFKRLFVMIEACKRNWMGACRPLISLDGCHLKGVTFGVLLTAVGNDANDGIVPIAWAIVNKENKHNWNWFLSWLKSELQLGDGSTITLMSDMQKGLMEAVKDQLPEAEHRWCARHIYANWSKKWRGEEMKKRFWISAWSSFEEEFKLNISKISSIKAQAAVDLLQYPPENWCRAYQSFRSCTNMVDNNISESFNSSIIEARHKPIISMLEDIRVLAMTRIRDRRNSANGWKCEWSPASMKLLNAAKCDAMSCKVIWNGEDGYEIGEFEDKHNVALDRKKCTCRMWELTGVPCCHALAAMFYSKLDPLSVMSIWYHKSSYMKTYEHSVQPVPGVKFWKINEDDCLEPPPVEKKTGRPKKMRVRAPNEPRRSNKLSRKGQKQHCCICKSVSHKKGQCPEKPSQVSICFNSN
ncbi:uncharacterized protein LOC131010465 [Salvia miltiorrhiza]|uniref:uncharacterized protein LOC131010465 n=1 Tax=Salvia miltiorrhiza TaxID=226208 RepID=UPI0025AC0DA0|nr:uncharacterized protein LOC131010465 [Salvia miltiorrhiza]XP_057793982.1 uncharacterized protein LOC131010465 [Salvia miltiorrhiza]